MCRYIVDKEEEFYYAKKQQIQHSHSESVCDFLKGSCLVDYQSFLCWTPVQQSHSNKCLKALENSVK